MAAEMYRNWCFVVYPDSAPDGWVEKLRGMHIPLFISPCHNHDLAWEAMGYSHNEWKHDAIFDDKGVCTGFRYGDRTLIYDKPHFHVEVCLDGKVTDKRVKKLFGDIAANGYIEPVINKASYARYLCHLDEHEKIGIPDSNGEIKYIETQFKYRYDMYKVLSFGGADYADTIKDDKTTNAILQEVFRFIEKEKCTSFSALVRYWANTDSYVSTIIRQNHSYVRAYQASKYKDLHPDEKTETSC